MKKPVCTLLKKLRLMTSIELYIFFKFFLFLEIFLLGRFQLLKMVVALSTAVNCHKIFCYLHKFLAIKIFIIILLVFEHKLQINKIDKIDKSQVNGSHYS